jgi:pilus assembly protein Flp/PilA
MRRIGKFFITFGRDTGGATAIEYGLIVALISAAVAAATATIGTSLTDMFQKLVNIFS